jgi:hypothetical protein
MRIVPTNPYLSIVNLHALPKGRGCRYLICITGEGGSYVAKQWRRTLPTATSEIEAVIDFEPEKSHQFSMSSKKRG